MIRIRPDQYETLIKLEPHFYLFVSSDTCRHCQKITPVLKKAFSDSDIPLYNLNDEDPNLHEEMGVDYYPTVVEIKNGEIIKKYIGYNRLLNEYGNSIQ